MIITRTHSKESLKDFEKDYLEDIRPRCFGFVKANRKLILRSQKLKEQKTKKESWVLCKGVRKIKTSRGNHYRVIVKARFNKKGEPGIMTTIYLILNDSFTGQKVVYLMPADKEDKGIISFSSKFFKFLSANLLLASIIFFATSTSAIWCIIFPPAFIHHQVFQ